MIEIKEVRDIENVPTEIETDLEKYLKLINSSEFGNYGKLKDSSIIFEEEEIPTKEIVFEGDKDFEAVVIFCASDESYITTEVREK